MSEAPSSARAVVIGGGIVGNSLFGHLAQLGWNELVLLDPRGLGDLGDRPQLRLLGDLERRGDLGLGHFGSAIPLLGSLRCRQIYQCCSQAVKALPRKPTATFATGSSPWRSRPAPR